MTSPPRVALIIPVRNGGEVWRRAAAAIRSQRRQPDRVLVIDSASSDGSDDVALEHGFDLRRIAAQDFDHGGTRQAAAEQCRGFDVLVYLTQDAVLADPHSLGLLLRAFEDPRVAVAYGRQLPRPEAGAIEAHGRWFNYPAVSQVRTLEDVPSLGIKAAFTSNAYCAYRAKDFFATGGFPSRLILSEDMVVAARQIQAGRAIAYVSESCVVHSHGYTIAQEFKRYFDIGVLHGDQRWLLRDFGDPEGDGMRFVKSELMHLARHAPWRMAEAVLRSAGKYLGYRAGRHAAWLPGSWRVRMSMHAAYWQRVDPMRRP